MEFVGFASGLVTLAALVAKVLKVAESMRGSSTKCHYVIHQLKTLDEVLKYIDQEFSQTAQLADARRALSATLLTTKETLEACLSDCSRACGQYDVLLRKIVTSSMSKLRWLKSQGELTRLHSGLEASKSTLNIFLLSIRDIRASHDNPPSYDAATSSNSNNCHSGLKVFAGFSGGALGGATIGSIAGPPGALIGGAVGGVVGLCVGIVAANKSPQESQRVYTRPIYLQRMDAPVRVRPRSRWGFRRSRNMSSNI